MYAQGCSLKSILEQLWLRSLPLLREALTKDNFPCITFNNLHWKTFYIPSLCLCQVMAPRLMSVSSFQSQNSRNMNSCVLMGPQQSWPNTAPVTWARGLAVASSPATTSRGSPTNSLAWSKWVNIISYVQTQFFILSLSIMTQVAFFLERFIATVNKVLQIICSGEGSCIGLWKVLLFSKVLFCRRLGINH